MIKQLPLTLILLTTNVAASPCNNLSATNLLLGQWQSTSDKHQISEQWQKLNDENFSGSSVTKSLSQPNKPPFVESLRLVKMGDDIFYLAKPPQNAMPTPFKLTTCSPNHVRFENPNHDFPKVIEYHRQDNRLTATVTDGGEKGFQIHYVKK